MAEDDAAFIKIRLVRAREIQAADIWTATGTVTTPTMGTGTYHVLAYTYRYMSGFDLWGQYSGQLLDYNGTVGGGEPAEEGEENLVEGGGEPTEPTDPPGGSGEAYYLSIPGQTADGSYQGFLQDSAISPSGHRYYALTSGITKLDEYLNEQGDEPERKEPVTGLKVKLMPGDEVTVCYYKPGPWKLPTGTGQVMVTHATHTTTPGITGYTGTNLHQQEVYYDIERTDGFDDAGVDSRKGYGQPNREGQFPADPNAELRNINFGDWVFKGGMFVGNMASSTGDKSGTARFQLWQQTASTSNVPRMMVTTVFQAGKGGSSGGMTVGLYAPLAGADLYLGESGTTWSNKWSITPRASIPSLGSYEQNKDPWRKFTVGSGDGAGLLSVSLTKVYDNPVSNGMGGYNYFTTWSTPVFDGLCYALDDEQALVDANFTGWRYFADKEFATGDYRDVMSSTFKDFGPRYWHFFVDVTYDESTWQPMSYGWNGFF